MTITTKQSITQIEEDDLVSPSITNQPNLDVEDNIDYLYNYVGASTLYFFDNIYTATNGLTFFYKGGTYRYGNALNVITDSSIAITDATTNYIEIDVATNTVVFNTTGFSNNNIALWKITTVGGSMTVITDKRSMMYALPQKLTTTDSPTFADVTVDNLDIGVDLIINGNLTVNGTSTTVNSTTVALDDVIMTLGGDTAPVVDDNKDRGIEFRWHDGASAKTGFFGWDDSINKLTFIPDGTNTSEVYAGTTGDVLFRTIESDVITGTAPLTVASITTVTNLSADMVDGYHAGNADGQVPVSNGTVNTNLNADLLDGYQSGMSVVTANTVPVRDSSGDVMARAFRTTWAEQSAAPVSTACVAFRTDKDTDDYVRFMTLNALQNYLGTAAATTTITAGDGLIGGGDLTTNRTISHDNTSDQENTSNSGDTVIQNLEFDEFGHVTNVISTASTSLGETVYIAASIANQIGELDLVDPHLYKTTDETYTWMFGTLGGYWMYNSSLGGTNRNRWNIPTLISQYYDWDWGGYVYSETGSRIRLARIYNRSSSTTITYNYSAKVWAYTDDSARVRILRNGVQDFYHNMGAGWGFNYTINYSDTIAPGEYIEYILQGGIFGGSATDKIGMDEIFTSEFVLP